MTGKRFPTLGHAFLPLLLLATGCKGPEANRELAKAEAVEMSDRAFEREYPRNRRDLRTPVVSDQGKYWMVEYDLPEGYAGGTPTFIVDKKTRKIVTHFSDQ